MWISPITFDRPAFLILLPVCLLGLWTIHRYSTASLNAVTRRQALFIRAIAVTLIVLCLAGIVFHRLTNRLTTIFVVDMSDSVSPVQRQATLRFIKASLKHQRLGDKVGLVVFGKEPFVEFPPSNSLNTQLVRAQVPGDGTDIESALEAASGAMPLDTGKRIVLCTDGLENIGGAASTVDQLKSAGIQVDIAPTMLSGSDQPEALVDRLVAPAHSSVNAPVHLRVVLSSTVQQSASLTITRDGKTIDSGKFMLTQGKSAYDFDDRVTAPGIHKYSVQLNPSIDTHPENNVASASVLVKGVPSVLFIRNANEPIPSGVTSALKAQGIHVDEQSPQSAPTTTAELSNFDSIVLSDVAAGDLSPGQLIGISEANESFGVGLGMLGGVNSFGAGGYVGTPIEDDLPVTLTPHDNQRVPGADVVIVLDASGSMAAEENGVEKVEIAAKAALQLLGAMQSKDRVAVLAVTETATIVMPLVSPTQSSKYVSDINAVSAGGGGIDCRNGLEAAYTMLQASDAAIKHVIICPDTTDSEQQEGCCALASAMYSGGRITTSVCGIGDWNDSDVPFQRSLANAGHGQLYVANQAGNLPQFFQRDVQNVKQKLFLEGVFGVQQTPSDAVAGIEQPMPAILGYNLVNPKSNATVPITLSDHHDPLVAYWRHGAGKSFVFTSDDDAHWSKNWLASPKYQSFWARLVRWSFKGAEDGSFQGLVTDIKGHGNIVVDAFDQNGYATEDHFDADIAGPSGSLKTVVLSETAPGRYTGEFDAEDIGSYLVQIRNTESGGRQTSSITTSYSPEYADLRPNTQLLGALSSGTGGIFLSLPAQVLRRGLPQVLGSTSLERPFLLLGAFLFLLDIAWRRLGLRPGKGSAEAARDKLRAGALVAAGSIKRKIARPTVDVFDETPISRYADSADAEFLKTRTAKRADMDEDDDPFPYVATLPSKGAEDRMKENK